MEKIELVTDEALEADLARCLSRRRLPDCFLYTGAGGAEKWLTLDGSATFPIAARLTELLAASLGDLQKHWGPRHNLVSVGIGSGQKERLILQEMSRESRRCYWCVDVSGALVDIALTAVADLEVDAIGVVAYMEDLDALKRLWREPVVLCLLGNNFCNYEPDVLLGAVAEALGEEDRFLFDCHLLEENDMLNPAYTSGLNAEFNARPLVARGLAETGFAFHIALVARQISVGRTYRTRKWLEIKKESRVAADGREIRLRAGEDIEMGFTYKFESGQVEALLKRCGFCILEQWFSPARENVLILAVRDHG
ncbi:MAG: L-histidine N(alpha)-methyltransferase [Phycisphaerae bacterium]|nr:L-histidine N(alpha)-methyltransferase [Phycisphaerae bacterium]